MDTSGPVYRSQLKPWGYLLAPTNATRELRKRAKQLRINGRAIVADNGNFELIGRLRQQYAARSQTLFAKVHALEVRLKRSVRKIDLPRKLRQQFQTLADQVGREALRLVDSRGNPIPRQLDLSPTHLIGAEDITVAAWLAVNLESTYTGMPRRLFQRMNQNVARRAVADRATLNEIAAQRYYPVASALSYNTAFDAGRVFAQAGHRRVSMGFGAYMADDNYSDSLEIGRKRVKLSTPMPNRYIRTVAAARGFWDGYRAEAGRAPDGFHFLGLGAPIMLALVALCAWDTAELTFDAMSPIKDAVEGTLYTSKPAYMKLRTRAVAYRLATNPGAVWDCPCPVCKYFLRRNPFFYKLGRTWHTRTKAREVKASDLQPSGQLFKAYPLLSEPSGGLSRRQVSEARMGHNHWVLNEITSQLGRHSGSKNKLKNFVQRVTDSYGRTTAAPRFREAIDFAFRIAISDV